MARYIQSTQEILNIEANGRPSPEAAVPEAEGDPKEYRISKMMILFSRISFIEVNFVRRTVGY